MQRAGFFPLFLLCAMGVVGGCADLPRDQNGATQRIRQSGVLLVGLSHSGGAMRAVEAREKRLVAEVARRLGARVQWKRGNAHVLLQELQEEKGRDAMALVAAAVSSDSPFARHLALSRPYLENGPEGKSFCLAVAPGENQLLLLVDQVIAAQS